MKQKETENNKTSCTQKFNFTNIKLGYYYSTRSTQLKNHFFPAKQPK